MNDDTLGLRIRDAFEPIATPRYPDAAIRARLSASRTPLAPPSARPVRASAAAAAVALVVAIGASAAIALEQPNGLSESVLRTLDRVGVHLRGKTWVTPRTVSLEEARAKADFPVVVPPGVRVVKTDLTVTPHGRAFVGLVLQYDGRSQIELEESRAEPSGPVHKLRGAYVIDANGKLRTEPSITWTIGTTQFVIGSYDARSRAFARHVRNTMLAAAAKGTPAR